MRGKGIGGLALDKTIHERARLIILAYLARARGGEVPFTELRDELGFSAGNLSIQLKVLSDAGYVVVDKRIRERRPFTGARLTDEGARALEAWLAEIESLVGSIRGEALQDTPGIDQGGRDGDS